MERQRCFSASPSPFAHPSTTITPRTLPVNSLPPIAYLARMKYQTLTLVASSPLIVGFAPQLSIHHRARDGNAINMRVSDKCTSFSHYQQHRLMAPSTFATKTQMTGLFARRKAQFEDDDDDEDELDYEEEEEEDEEDGMFGFVS